MSDGFDILRPPRIAVCFFGITRSLSYTLPSIRENILIPARECGNLRVFGHFFRQSKIHNPRSGEYGELNIDEYQLLECDQVELEEPDVCLDLHRFEEVKSFGDSWMDDFTSLRNLIHQLHSLEKVTRRALSWEADIYVFARPDLLYHDSLAPHLRELMRSTEGLVVIPDWQHLHGGYNDRFAICGSGNAAAAYGLRIENCLEFCRDTISPLHAEELLRYALDKAGVMVTFMPVKASRVRANGTMRVEDFSDKPRHKRNRTTMRVLTGFGPGRVIHKMLFRMLAKIRHRKIG